jgi:hypothetical protein
MASAGSHSAAAAFLDASFDRTIEHLNFFYLAQGFLGDIRAWPSNVLSILFILPYSCTNAHTLAVFMYGNRLPLHVALAFYIV